jgi:hypothetical protein
MKICLGALKAFSITGAIDLYVEAKVAVRLNVDRRDLLTL